MLTALILVTLSVLLIRDVVLSALLTHSVLTLTQPMEALPGEEQMLLVLFAILTLTHVFLLAPPLLVALLILIVPPLVSWLVLLAKLFVYNVYLIPTVLGQHPLVMWADKFVYLVPPMYTARVVRVVLMKFALFPLLALL